jgi:DNA-binding transcriptional LysR family regulator
VLAEGTGLHELVEEALRVRGVGCTLVEYPTAETIKTAVELGMGVTILPRSAVREEVGAGKLVGREILDWPGGERLVRAVVRAGGKLSKEVEAFVALLREMCVPGASPLTRTDA